ncbi:MAG: hypothetical protein RLZZ450_3866 [Pseudomonadota bacterium]|jgi:hypothetical protein
MTPDFVMRFTRAPRRAASRKPRPRAHGTATHNTQMREVPKSGGERCSRAEPEPATGSFAASEPTGGRGGGKPR